MRKGDLSASGSGVEGSYGYIRGRAGNKRTLTMQDKLAHRKKMYGSYVPKDLKDKEDVKFELLDSASFDVLSVDDSSLKNWSSNYIDNGGSNKVNDQDYNKDDDNNIDNNGNALVDERISRGGVVSDARH